MIHLQTLWWSFTLYYWKAAFNAIPLPSAVAPLPVDLGRLILTGQACLVEMASLVHSKYLTGT